MKKFSQEDIIVEEEKSAINWYPGHMARAIREIKERLKLVDIVLEIRDARAPLISSNPKLDEILLQKSRLIIFNKANLADPKMMALWQKWFEKMDTPFLFVDCFEKGQIKKVMAMSKSIVNERKKAANPENFKAKEKFKLMVIGLPNTGKSTIINQLANRNATKTANRPGLTQVQQWINIDQNLDLLDTPGVMPPSIANQTNALCLSAIHAIPDDILGEEQPAKFLVEYFKERNSQEFLNRYKLDSYAETSEETLGAIAQSRGCLKQKGLPDLERVYKLILIDFRSGELGKCCFGTPPV
ncbi:MAG: ribosome biogenesis GTPase YlqF [Bacteriovorax sp.]|nr:ribosome biogenesis GTPase YlqF [Bacteriovorax sp.]